MVLYTPFVSTVNNQDVEYPPLKRYGFYLFFPYFFLQAEDSFDNIISYGHLGQSNQVTIAHIEQKSDKYTPNTNTPSGCPYMINTP